MKKKYYLSIILFNIIINVSAQCRESNNNPNCVVDLPAPLFKSHPSELKAYHAIEGTHEMRESGEDVDGVVFSLYRAGCLEYGEVFVFRFPLRGIAKQPMSYWIHRMGKSLEVLGKLAKNESIQKRARQIQDLSKIWSPQVSPKIENELVEITLEEEKDSNRMKVQLTMGGGF